MLLVNNTGAIGVEGVEISKSTQYFEEWQRVVSSVNIEAHWSASANFLSRLEILLIKQYSISKSNQQMVVV